MGRRRHHYERQHSERRRDEVGGILSQSIDGLYKATVGKAMELDWEPPEAASVIVESTAAVFGHFLSHLNPRAREAMFHYFQGLLEESKDAPCPFGEHE